MTELVKKILIGIGAVVGVWFVLAITFVSFLPESEKTKVTLAVQEESETDVEESSMETVTTEKSEDASVEELEPSVEKTDFVTKAKDKINEIKENYEDEKAKKNEIHPTNKQEILEQTRKCIYFQSKKNIDRLKQYDKDLVVERLNKFLKYNATHTKVEDISITWASSIVDTYVKIYGETEATKELQKVIDKHDKLKKECPSKSDLKIAIAGKERDTEWMNESQWLQLYLYKRVDAEEVLTDGRSISHGDNAYFAKYGNEDVVLFSDQDYPNEGSYDIFCMSLNYINIVGTDSDGFESEMQAYLDSSYLEGKIEEYQTIINAPKKLTKAKKQLVKLMKKGL